MRLENGSLLILCILFRNGYNQLGIICTSRNRSQYKKDTIYYCFHTPKFYSLYSTILERIEKHCNPDYQLYFNLGITFQGDSKTVNFEADFTGKLDLSYNSLFSEAFFYINTIKS